MPIPTCRLAFPISQWQNFRSFIRILCVEPRGLTCESWRQHASRDWLEALNSSARSKSLTDGGYVSRRGRALRMREFQIGIPSSAQAVSLRGHIRIREGRSVTIPVFSSAAQIPYHLTFFPHHILCPNPCLHIPPSHWSRSHPSFPDPNIHRVNPAKRS